MSKATLFNLNIDSPAQIHAELYQDVGASTFQLGTYKRGFYDVQIYHGADSDDTLLQLDIDYTLEDEDTYYTDMAGFAIYTGIKIINATYQVGDLFISYKCIGTYTDKDTYSAIEAAVVAAVGKVPVGVSLSYDGIDIPDNYLAEDGSSLSRTTYATLYAAITKSKGTVTFTNGTDLCNLNSHGLATGDCVEFTTSDTLPAELTANTNYYVIYNDANSFQVAETLADAIAGTQIDITDDGTGTHTLRHCPWGIDGASNFLLPDKRGVSEEGKGTQGTAAWASANYLGGLGQYKQDQGQAWQLGASSDSTGERNTYACADSRYKIHATSAWATGVTMLQRTDLQGITNKLKAVDNGTHGTIRDGYITAGPRVGVNKIIRYQ
jgi:hypothetical protein